MKGASLPQWLKAGVSIANTTCPPLPHLAAQSQSRELSVLLFVCVCVLSSINLYLLIDTILPFSFFFFPS